MSRLLCSMYLKCLVNVSVNLWNYLVFYCVQCTVQQCRKAILNWLNFLWTCFNSSVQTFNNSILHYCNAILKYFFRVLQKYLNTFLQYIWKYFSLISFTLLETTKYIYWFLENVVKTYFQIIKIGLIKETVFCKNVY